MRNYLTQFVLRCSTIKGYINNQQYSLSMKKITIGEEELDVEDKDYPMFVTFKELIRVIDKLSRKK